MMNSTMRRLAATFAFIMVGLFCQQAAAYSILYDNWGYPRIWNKNTVQYTIAANGSDNITLNQIESSIGAAFASWTDIPCTAINFTFNGFKNFNPNQDIFIRWLETNWDMTVQDAMGVTTNWKLIGAGQGVKKVEIFFNGQDFEWTTEGADDPFSNKVDVQAVATHEIGHAIGLNHSRERFATMFFTAFPGQTEAQRKLDEDDKRAACFLYPAVPFTQGKVCDACDQASNCNTGVCFSYGEEGAFCGMDCSSTPCPEGFGCYSIANVTNPQCIPDNEHCAPVGGNIPVGDYCYDHSTCASGRCLVLPESAVCSKECNPSAGGNAGCPSSMQCVGEGFDGICYPKGSQQLGEQCKSPADCESFLCMGVGGGEGVCTQDCTSNAQCPSSMTCVVDKCLKLGSAQHGDPCTKMTDCATGICANLLGYCSTLCETDADCPFEGQCLLAGVCNAGASGKEGDVCGPDAKTCQSGLKCTYAAQGDTTGICRTRCDVRYEGECPKGTYCEWMWQSWLNQVIGVCSPSNGGLGLGADCGGDAYCLPDLVCADTDGTGAKCRQDCKTTNFLGCSNGATCVALDLANDPQLGACHPKGGTPAVEQAQVVETTMDAGSTAPPSGDTSSPPRSDAMTTPPEPTPSNTGSSGGGCRTNKTGNAGWMWVLMGLFALRYTRRSIWIKSS